MIYKLMVHTLFKAPRQGFWTIWPKVYEMFDVLYHCFTLHLYDFSDYFEKKNLIFYSMESKDVVLRHKYCLSLLLAAGNPWRKLEVMLKGKVIASDC